MQIEQPFVLPADVVLSPASELPAASLAQLECAEGDYVLTRPRSRVPSMIVDARTRRLLELFRSPATLVSAVIGFSTSEKLDPAATLEDAFPALQRIINAELLVPAGSPLESLIENSFGAGDSVGQFTVVEPITVLVDTEIYLARDVDATLVAVKLSRRGAERRLTRRFEREALILQHLDGSVAPRFLARGVAEERPFIASEWVTGVDANVAAVEARRRGRAGLQDLLSIVQRIADVYARLHAQGVIHGDIHPGNVIVDGNGRPTLIDFGLACLNDSRGGPLAPLERGVVDLYMEPELAAARRTATPSPAASIEGEQYAIAALLYFLLTGGHTHNFVLEEQQMLRQIVEEPPLPFADHGTAELTRLEDAIGRALAKDPRHRFASVAEFAREIALAVKEGPASPPRRPASLRTRGHADTFVDRLIDGVSKPGSVFGRPVHAPTASFHNGAAGIAYTLLRIARTREDGRLLALADLWSNQAVGAVLANAADAFDGGTPELNPDSIGPNSLYHAASGVFCVDALIAHARGDDTALRRAVAAFVTANEGDGAHADVSQGWAGALLGCSVLLDVQAADSSAERQSLLRLGADLAARLTRELISAPASHPAQKYTYLGAAHGWAGQLYAILRWGEAAAAGIPPEIHPRLHELTRLATPIGSGLRWPVTMESRGRSTLWASWCNGAAGFVHLWTLAARRFGGESYHQLASGAAWAAYQAPSRNADLCCGLAGRAYALFNMHRSSGDARWADRGRELAALAAQQVTDGPSINESLYKGDLGVGLLLSDLAAPESARMPLFEHEGWRPRMTTSISGS
jgi:serine/threonine-protein kinase